MTRISTALTALLLALGCCAASAQTIGFAEAVDRLATSCGKDIGRYCKTVNLGGGQIFRCLDQKAASISPQCRAAQTQVTSLLAVRAAARAAIPTVCDVDARRFCAGIQVGDGNLMECFYKTKARMSPQCQRAVSEAGYE